MPLSQLTSSNPTINPFKTSLFIDRLAILMILVGIAFIAFSRSVDNLITVGALLWFLRHPRSCWRLLRPLTVSWLTLAVIACLGLGVLYTQAPDLHGLYQWKKYSLKLLAFLCLIPVFSQQHYRQLAIHTLIISTCLATFIFTLQTIHSIDLAQIFHKPADHVIAPLQLSIQISFVCWYLINMTIEQTGKRWYTGLLLLALLSYQLFINIERTGMLITFLLGLLLVWQRLPKQRWWLIGLAPLLAMGLYYGSAKVQHRFSAAVDEAIHHADPSYRYRSIALRIAFLQYSVQLIQQAPWLGHGTGSFAAVYEATDGPQLTPDLHYLGDPHNTYLHLAVQIGLIGLGIFIAWLLCQWRDSYRFMPSTRYLSHGILFTFCVSSLFVASFVLNQPCFLFLTLMAHCYGQQLANNLERLA